MNKISKIQLVVCNENTLGYILPYDPTTLNILHASILKGATFNIGKSQTTISISDIVRLASEKDFNDFRVDFEGYRNDSNYIYEK
ncbi:hypothetical protein M2451_003897 [Dysgonomonas sp. PFB1-18]|nr:MULTISPECIES: hypothetical protein [unclassified Dysgonomonas]MDH6311059.1 hypothetical protein [Dysgonomonas sp. PF1-14]MDH6382556.1 hypothetical protein [Dysgonomonas sp. PFB1-18]MDH6399910.1 hypothetical protein [Dysgonomonas sp. PF1-23]